MVGVRAGGWFSLCLAAFNASLMLLWFWGNSKKTSFFAALTMPLQSFLRLEAASDNQLSLTIAQQKVRVKDSGSTIKRARGAPPANPVLMSVVLVAACSASEQ